jgi:hypothetical protein
VQHDIYYIENWSVWHDIQIILLTSARWRQPSGYERLFKIRAPAAGRGNLPSTHQPPTNDQPTANQR